MFNRLRKKNLAMANRPLFKRRQALWMSFYSPRLYLDAYKNWRWFGFLYVLLAIAVFAIPLSYKVVGTLSHNVAEKVENPIKKIPKFTIKDGIVQFPYEMPYLIKNGVNQVAIVVDTSDIKRDFVKQYPDAFLIIKKDKFLFRMPNVQAIKQTFLNQKTSPDEYIDQPLAGMSDTFDGSEWLKTSRILILMGFIKLLVYPGIVFGIWGIYLLVVPAFAMLAQFLAVLFFKINLPFVAACRTCSVALTPQIFLLTMALASSRLIPGAFWLFMLVSLLYMLFVIAIIKREGSQLVRT